MEEVFTKKESIGNGVFIYTSAKHSFGTDAILLADFAAPKAKDIACDLGSGCGIIPFLWCRREKPKSIYAVEMQENAVALMQQSVALNALEKTIRVIHGDLREIDTLPLTKHTFSLVSMNPPYFPEKSGFESKDESRRLARHALTCSTEDIVRSAEKLLKYGGRLCLCHKPEQLAHILHCMQKYQIEPKKLRFVSGKSGKAPYLVLVEGKRGAKPGLKVLPELHVQNADSSWSPEMLKIYGDYGDGTKQ